MTSATPERTGIGARLKRAFGPMLAGLAIDALDLMTFGPIGIYTGVILGGLAGWWLAPELGFAQRSRWVCALLTGLYCTIPLTGFLPLAAVVAGLTRFFDTSGDDAVVVKQRARGADDAIEVDYESDWDEPDAR